MKKLLKKISAVMLTAAMAAGMCFTSLAVSTGAGTQFKVEEGSKSNISVGVSSPEDASANGGDTLLAYKVVDITYNGTSNTLHYGFTDLFTAFLENDLGNSWTGLTPEAYGELTDNELKPLLGNFTAYIKQQDPKPEAAQEQKADADGVAKFTAMDMGQYIIVGDGSSQGAKIYQTVTAEVEPEVVDGQYMLYPDYTVAMKTSTPSIGKNITEGTTADDTILTGTQPGDKHNGHQQTSSVGKEINYNLTVNVPTYPQGATNQTFFVGDTLSKGLELLQPEDGTTIVVKGFVSADDTEGEVLDKDTAYTFEVKQNNQEGEDGTTVLYVDFKFAEIAKFDHVVIEYKAKLTADAELGTITGNPNNADLVYSNSPFDGNTWKPGQGERPDDQPGYGKDEDMEIVYTYALVIDKFEEKHEDEKLAGAVFEIYDNKELTGTPIATITTDDNGAAVYAGLQKGTYYLKETVAPAGYNLMDEAIEIVIDGSKVPYYAEAEKTVTHYTYTMEVKGDQARINGDYVWMNSNGEVVTTPDATAPAGYSAAYVENEGTTVENVILVDRTDAEGENAANGFYKAGVSNNKGAHLPSTGGMGTTIFTVVGVCLMLGAAIVLITRRRMSGK